MWAVDHWGVEPDILLTAKGIASGMTLGAHDRQGRAARDMGPGRARLDLRRQPGRLRRGARDDRAARGRPHRQRRRPRRPGAGRTPAARRPLRRARPRRPRQGPHARRRVRHGRARRGGPVGLLRARPARPRMRQVERPDVAGADGVRGRDGRPRCASSARRSPRSPVAARRSGACARSRRPADRRRTDDTPVAASKVASMRDAIADLVRDGDTVAIEGFTHLISFAAGHEIIRQGRRDLTLARLTPGRHLRPDDRGGRRLASSSSRGSATRASAGSGPSAGGSRARSPTSRSRSRSTATSGWSGATRRAR